MKISFKQYHRIARIIFWVAQIIGIVTIISLLIFFGGTIIDELVHQVIDFKEDYSIFVLFLCEIFVAVAIVISWKKSKLGAFLIIALIILEYILNRDMGLTFILLHLPLLVTGLLLLFYAYYREWTLKKEKD